MKDEIWKPVLGHEGFYEVSNLGRVRSLPRTVEKPSRWGTLVKHSLKGRMLKPGRVGGAKRKHVHVILSVENVHRQAQVHTLILEAFVGPAPDGMECRHLDGNGSNNVLTNLKWGTRFENMEDRTRLGEHNPPIGVRNHRSVLKDDDVREIRLLLQQGYSHAQISSRFSVARSAIGKISTKKTWAWL